MPREAGSEMGESRSDDCCLGCGDVWVQSVILNSLRPTNRNHTNSAIIKPAQYFSHTLTFVTYFIYD